MTEAQLRASLVRRYWQYVIQNPVGCWGWSGNTTEAGYGQLGTGRAGQVLVHRLAFEIHHGPIPDGLWVLHHCDNPPCTRPEDIYVGDQFDNGNDIIVRKTSLKPTCRRGHEKTPENTYIRIDRRGYVERHCKTCSPHYRNRA